MHKLEDYDLESLPVWAAAAFAAYAARAVFPQFLQAYVAITPEEVADMERAVFIAEILATLGHGIPNYAATADGDHAVDALPSPQRKVPDHATVHALGDAAAAAAYCADVAADLTGGQRWAKREDVYRLARRALAGALACQPAHADLWRGFQAVQKAVAENAWTDASPVSPAVFRHYASW